MYVLCVLYINGFKDETFLNALSDMFRVLVLPYADLFAIVLG